MFPDKRRVALLALIRQRGAAKISELSETLNVSEVTIRRDLQKLKKQRYIRRAHGGVFSVDVIKRELSFDERIIRNSPQKKRIGKKAASLIQESDTIFISTGTTTMQIVQNIDEEKNLVVCTNCVMTGYEMSKLPNVCLVMLGGELRRPSYALVGSKAMEGLNRMAIDKFFLGVEGISRKHGITIASEFEAEICRKIIALSKTIIVGADSTKFGKVVLAKISDLDKIDVLITDSQVKSEYINSLKGLGIKLIII